MCTSIIKMVTTQIEYVIVTEVWRGYWERKPTQVEYKLCSRE